MSVLDILPPSPPNTSHRGRMPLPRLSKHVASTPDGSPTSLILPSSGTGARKRVEFSSCADVLNQPSSDPLSEDGALRTIPRSRDCRSMIKSILKPYAESDLSTFGADGTDDAQSIITMESIIEQLGNNDKISSVDAYQSLAQLVKTYDEIPDDSNTKDNVSMILRYVKRDLNAQDQAFTAPIDTNLITQALKVSVIFVWSEHLSPLLNDDFRIFIVDRAINALAEHTAPKVVIVHYMHLLAMQNFKSAMFTAGNRTSKLLEALREITTHVQGKGAISERLLVYQRLIEQAKPMMKLRAGLWIKEVLMGLSSKIKDIQEKAMSVCNKTCSAFPLSPVICQAAREALSETTKDKTLNSLLTQRLANMIAAKDEAFQVPQIWAQVMLMCSSTESRPENWTHTKEWLKVLQRCFNCSDVNVRIEAFPAWNRFIYVTRPHEASDAMVSMLAKPIVAQIERTSGITTGRGTRPAAISSYCFLLYYAFRMAASHKQYTRAWNEYIVKVATTQFLSKSTANSDLVCRALIALFWRDAPTTQIWNENRAHENKPMEPEELPTIDCKWIRSRSEAILQIFGLLFKYSAWGPSTQNSDQAFVAKAWKNFIKAVRESASKEVKPSQETRKALSNIVNFLQTAAKPELDGSVSNRKGLDSMNERVRIACGIVVNELGPLVSLESLESIESSTGSELLGEVLKQILATFESVEIRGVGNKAAPALLQRGLSLLANEIRNFYPSSSREPETLTFLLELSTHTIMNLPKNGILKCLQVIEQPLAVLIRDESQCRTQDTDSTPLSRAWRKLSMATIDKITTLPIAQYLELDNLFAAALSSTHQDTVNYILRAWNEIIWQESEMAFGPELLTAIARIQTRVEVNLPGVNTRFLSVDIDAAPRPNECLNGSVEVSDTVQETEQVASSELVPQVSILSPNEMPPPELERRARTDTAQVLEQQQLNQYNKLRHDDSQIQFVPVASSPPIVDKLESQFLTERQKDVRDRQRAEQTVTFADIRTSPQDRSARKSRATSADCEMARKIAALDGMPTTPTLSRQNDRLLDEVEASPTPKARQAFRIANIDIPSSTVSVAENGNFEAALNQIDVSPSKVVSFDEMYRLDTEAAHTMSDILSREPFAARDLHFEQSKDRLASDQASPIQARALDVATDMSVHDTVMQGVEDSDAHTRPSQCGTEDKTTHQFRSIIRTRGKSKSTRPPTDSDELDEASASQLSQDLDWHIMEETRTSEGPVDMQADERRSSKKRKRSETARAPSDRKHQRRKMIRKSTDAPASSGVDPSRAETFITESHSDDAADCIVVRPLVSKLSPHVDNAELTSEPETPRSQSPASSSGRRRRGRPKKSKRTSSRSSAVQEEPKEATVGNKFHPLEETERSTPEFHTPTHVHIDSEIISEQTPSRINHATTPVMVVTELSINNTTAQTSPLHIMTALQTALDGLKQNKQASIDLRAIDDLCFQIRFQAQENLQGRDQM